MNGKRMLAVAVAGLSAFGVMHPAGLTAAEGPPRRVVFSESFANVHPEAGTGGNVTRGDLDKLCGEMVRWILRLGS